MKKKTLIIGILIVIVLILVCWVIYRYSVISKIKKLEEESINISNLYFKIEETTDTSNTIIQSWKKNNVVKTCIEVNDTSVTMWADFDSDKGLVLYENSKEYTEDDSAKDGVLTSVPLQNYIIANNSAFALAINPAVKISTEEYNEKECLYIKLGDEEAYTDKETGITLYEYYTQTTSSLNENMNETESYYMITTKVDYSIDTVTDSDVAKPDTSEYALAE